MKDRINEGALKSKNKNIRNLYRGINKFNKDENVELLADSHNILNRWKKYSHM
jgi:hypothetical protein